MRELFRIAILDTAILLLYLVRETDPSLLKTFKRVTSFDETDLALLGAILRQFGGLVTTPHVLAEVNNFVDQAPSHRRAQLLEKYRNFIAAQDEIYEEAKALADRKEFSMLGLADTGLSSLSDRYTVITTDFQLAGKIGDAGGSVINFQQVRSARILPSF